MTEAICPNGHLSDDSVTCDQCGAAIGGEPDPPVITFVSPKARAKEEGSPAPAEAAPAAPSPEVPKLPEPAKSRAFAPPSWTIVATADRAYYDRMQADEIPFPEDSPDRTFTLGGIRIVIGRRSAARGVEVDIDLAETPEAPEDPGVSHMHAVLLGSVESGWTILDVGSANGTFLNESTDPIQRSTAVPLHDGDRIHVGAWTTLTLRRS